MSLQHVIYQCDKCTNYYQIHIQDIDRVLAHKECNHNTLLSLKVKLPSRGLTYSQRQWENYTFEQKLKWADERTPRFQTIIESGRLFGVACRCFITRRLNLLSIILIGAAVRMTQSFRSRPVGFQNQDTRKVDAIMKGILRQTH